MEHYEIKNVRRLSAGARTYYFARIPNDVVDRYTKVLVVESSGENLLAEDELMGYQRPASAARQRTIGNDYLKNHPDEVVPPCVVNGAGSWIFTPDDSSGEFGCLSVQGPAHVIDGQHRLGGFVHLWQEHEIKREIDLIVYEQLDIPEEIKIFHTINDSQVGVAKAIGAFNMLEEDNNWIAWNLNVEPESPFHDKISRIGKLGADKLFNLNSVATNVKRSFDHGSMDDIQSRETRLDYLITYWSIIRDYFPNEWSDIDRPTRQRSFKLLELTGLIAWSLIAPTIFGRSYDEESQTMDWGQVATLIGRTVGIDWSKQGKFAGRTGEGGGRLLLRDMERMVDRSEIVQDTTLNLGGKQLFSNPIPTTRRDQR